MLHRRFVKIAAFGVAAATAVSLMAPASAVAAITVKLSGSTTVQPLAQFWASGYKSANPGSVITVAGGGSGAGFKDVAGGKVDIGMSSREKTSADPAGLIMHEVARDAIGVIVNPKNKVKRLTSAQVKGIFTGTITNWKQLGGANKAIVLVGRTGASGTYEFFKEKFLLGSRQSRRTKMYVSNGMVRSAVSRSPYAIGYVSISFINSRVRGLYINGVAPTKRNALNRTYPYVRDLYFITNGTPSASAQAFINYARSAAGQRIAAREYLALK
jgi:phosphate transport system substrate-binding protein